MLKSAKLVGLCCSIALLTLVIPGGVSAYHLQLSNLGGQVVAEGHEGMYSVRNPFALGTVSSTCSRPGETANSTSSFQVADSSVSFSASGNAEVGTSFPAIYAQGYTDLWFDLVVAADPGDSGGVYIEVDWNSQSNGGAPGLNWGGVVDAKLSVGAYNLDTSAWFGETSSGHAVLGPVGDGSLLTYRDAQDPGYGARAGGYARRDVVFSASASTQLSLTLYGLDHPGACCSPDGSCTVVLQPDCQTPNTWHPEWSSCATDPCPEPTGACCLPEGNCQALTSQECWGLGGFYMGDTTGCAADPCLQVGACCWPDGGCSLATEDYCSGGAGTYKGNGTSCNPDSCYVSSVGDGSRSPSSLRLSVIPNPGTGRVGFSYQLPRASTAVIEIFSAGGALVRRIEEGPRPAGQHFVSWDADDAIARRLPSGVYLARLTTSGGSTTARVVVAR